MTVAWAMRRTLPQPIICLITDRTLASGRPLEEVVAAAVEGGVTMVQLREKDLPAPALLDLAVRLRGAIGRDALLLINGSLQVALDAGADGVHLPADAALPLTRLRGAARRSGGPGATAALQAPDEPPVHQAVGRESRVAVAPPAGGYDGLLVGRSVHSLAEIATAASAGADYVELGTIFPSRSHPGGTVQGTGIITQAARSGVPVLAVGGITGANAADVIAAGASGVAVISAILADRDPRGAARRLADAVREAWARVHGMDADGRARAPRPEP